MDHREQHGCLSIRELGVRAGGARLVEDVSLDLEPGQVVGLIGPNGAGKSTLLRSIAGVGHGGEATSMQLDGDDLLRISARDIARRMAYVSQTAPDTHGFTALEVVLTGRYPHLRRMEVEGARDRAIARDAMERTETDAFAERDAATLSGGERQRVFVARALAQDGQVLVLDEPTASLDVRHQLAVFELARQVAARGVTVVAAVHDLRLAARFCDRLVLMCRGRILADGTPAEVLTADRIAAVFGVRAAVHQDPVTGYLAIEFGAPAQPAPVEQAATRLHVICGGGSGSEILRELATNGFRVTAGPLGEGDIDLLTARSLGIDALAHPPFAPVDDELHERHKEAVSASDITVLCDADFGAGNVRSIGAARAAHQLVVLETRSIAERDFTGGRASHSYAALRPARRVSTVADLLSTIHSLIDEQVGSSASPIASGTQEKAS